MNGDDPSFLGLGSGQVWEIVGVLDPLGKDGLVASVARIAKINEII